MIPYTVTFSAVAVSATQECFQLVAPAARWLSLDQIFLGQYSDAGDAQDELLSVLIITGYTVASAGGGAFTPLPLDSRRPAATATARINDTTLANTGTPATRWAETFNVRAGWYLNKDTWLSLPRPHQRKILIAPSAQCVVRITAPADSITMNGTLLFTEYEPTDDMA